MKKIIKGLITFCRPSIHSCRSFFFTIMKRSWKPTKMIFSCFSRRLWDSIRNNTICTLLFRINFVRISTNVVFFFINLTSDIQYCRNPSSIALSYDHFWDGRLRGRVAVAQQRSTTVVTCCWPLSVSLLQQQELSERHSCSSATTRSGGVCSPALVLRKLAERCWISQSPCLWEDDGSRYECRIFRRMILVWWSDLLFFVWGQFKCALY